MAPGPSPLPVSPLKSRDRCRKAGSVPFPAKSQADCRASQRWLNQVCHRGSNPRRDRCPVGAARGHQTTRANLPVQRSYLKSLLTAFGFNRYGDLPGTGRAPPAKSSKRRLQNSPYAKSAHGRRPELILGRRHCVAAKTSDGFGRKLRMVSVIAHRGRR